MATKSQYLLILLMPILITACQETDKKYYTNGNIKEEYVMKDGSKNGFGKMYYSSGELMWQGEYVNGKRNGKSINYFKNGNKKKEGTYLNDSAIGTWKEYYESSTLKKECSFSNGKQNGWLKEYYENGGLKTKQFWKQDIQIGESMYYYPNSKLKQESLVDSSGTVVYHRTFDEQGNEIEEKRYIYTKPISGTQISLGDTFKLEIDIKGPLNGLKAEILTGEIFGNKRVISMGYLPFKGSKGMYMYIPQKTGTYTWQIWVDIENPKTKKFYHYENSSTFSVVGNSKT